LAPSLDFIWTSFEVIGFFCSLFGWFISEIFSDFFYKGLNIHSIDFFCFILQICPGLGYGVENRAIMVAKNAVMTVSEIMIVE